MKITTYLLTIIQINVAACDFYWPSLCKENYGHSNLSNWVIFIYFFNALYQVDFHSNRMETPLEKMLPVNTPKSVEIYPQREQKIWKRWNEQQVQSFWTHFVHNCTQTLVESCLATFWGEQSLIVHFLIGTAVVIHKADLSVVVAHQVLQRQDPPAVGPHGHFARQRQRLGGRLQQRHFVPG